MRRADALSIDFTGVQSPLQINFAGVPLYFLDGRAALYKEDCRDVLKTLPNNSIDSIVCDPPYHLQSIVKRFGGKNSAPAQFGSDGAFARASRGFMGKQWDGGNIACDPAVWTEALRILKPGGHLCAFGGTRTYHRMTVAIEDAGFEIRDQLAWIYGSGFPKSRDVSKDIDKTAGAKREVIGKGISGKTAIWSENGGMGDFNITTAASSAAKQWQGWGTALKPGYENIVLARKPLSEKTVAANVMKWGTGALNIDGCRVERGPSPSVARRATGKAPSSCRPGEYGDGHAIQNRMTPERWLKPRPGRQFGRWPANLVHDGSEEVLEGFPNTKKSKAGRRNGADIGGVFSLLRKSDDVRGHDDSGGSAARFFYCAKASKRDRRGSKHPTIKPVKLIQWLVRLVTPPNGTVLDMFAGSGTTGEAAYLEGFSAVLIELEAEYQADIKHRIEAMSRESENMTKLKKIAKEFPDMEFKFHAP
jgi:site-specific DNA-methyltransferase (adenine-specific)